MAKLTALEIKHLTKPGRYGDGNGLYFRIKPSGAKSWVLRVVFDGRRHDVGLGPYPKISLAEARLAAADHHTLIAQGRNPLAEKVNGDLPTFAEAAELYHQANTPRWTNAQHTKTWLSSLRKYAYPSIGQLPVNRISQTHILEILLPIWTEKRETASRLRQRIRSVFAFSMAHNWVDHNPAGEAIDGGLPKIPRLRAHHPAIHYSQVPQALNAIRLSLAYTASKLCFEFLVLTAARSGEARLATWDEIDLEEALWTVPANRIKSRTEHRVPLSPQVIQLLQEARLLKDSTNLVFPSLAARPLSDSTLSKLLRENHIPAVPHGFRSSFRDWAAENTQASWAAMELSLAHRIGNDTERAYARSDLFNQRRLLMQQWADYLLPTA